MRTNIYSQETTGEIRLLAKRSENGRVYGAIAFMLRSGEWLHNKPDDDDRSAVIFWLGSERQAEELAKAFDDAAIAIRKHIEGKY